MKSHPSETNRLRAFMPLLLILTVVASGIIFHLSQAVIVPIVTALVLALGARALWVRANKDANGSEWWQDNDPSGWRGY